LTQGLFNPNLAIFLVWCAFLPQFGAKSYATKKDKYYVEKKNQTTPYDFD